MDIGCVTIVILARTKTNAETKNNKQKGIEVGMELKFDLGKQVMTQGIANILGDGKICEELLDAFGRYTKCDWGDIPEEDKALNDEAVRVGDGRTLAAYNTSKGEIWIITDFGDEGNVTTMLLPEEY